MESGAGERESARASELVTAIVHPGNRTAYERLRAEFAAKAAEFPGFSSLEVFPPSADDDRWTAVTTFDTASDLQNWRTSPERAELVRRIRKLADDRDWVLPSGFRRWSSRNGAAGSQPPAWKQAMTALAVLYATVSVLDITLGNFIGSGLRVEGNQVVAGLGLSLPLVIFIGNAVGTIMLTWLLMPVVNRVLDWWLRPTASQVQTIRGVVLLLVVYLIEVSFFDWIYRTFGF